MHIGRQDGQTVRRGDVNALAEYNIAIAVTVRRGPEIRRVIAEHGVKQSFGIDRVWVRVPAAKGLAWLDIHQSVCRRAQPVNKRRRGVRPGHGMHAVKANLKASCDHGFDLFKIKQGFH